MWKNKIYLLLFYSFSWELYCKVRAGGVDEAVSGSVTMISSGQWTPWQQRWELHVHTTVQIVINCLRSYQTHNNNHSYLDIIHCTDQSHQLSDVIQASTVVQCKLYLCISLVSALVLCYYKPNTLNCSACIWAVVSVGIINVWPSQIFRQLIFWYNLTRQPEQTS